MNGFVLDPDSVTSAAARLDAQREALTAHTDDVRVAAGSGNPWGDDRAGSAFGAIYADVLGHVADVMASHIALLDHASTQLRAWATTALAADDRAAVRFEELP